MLKLGRLYCTSKRGGGLTYLPLADNVTNYVQKKNELTTQLAFLIISFTPSLINIAQISSHS